MDNASVVQSGMAQGVPLRPHMKGFSVAFTLDVTPAQAEKIMEAVRQFQGIAGVEPVESLSEDSFARMRVDDEWVKKLAALAPHRLKSL